MSAATPSVSTGSGELTFKQIQSKLDALKAEHLLLHTLTAIGKPGAGKSVYAGGDVGGIEKSTSSFWKSQVPAKLVDPPTMPAFLQGALTQDEWAEVWYKFQHQKQAPGPLSALEAMKALYEQTSKAGFAVPKVLLMSKNQAALYEELLAQGKPPLDKGGVVPIQPGFAVYDELAPWPPPTPDVKVYHKSTKDDHGTPWPLFSLIQQFFGTFDLDPCADPWNAKCPIYFDEQTNGLSMDWFGTVFVNPPYSKVGKWVAKAICEIEAGHCEKVVLLVAARPDTNWWFQAWKEAYRVVFLKGRVVFEGSKNSAPFPSALIELRPQNFENIFMAEQENDKSMIPPVIVWDWKKGPISEDTAPTNCFLD